jgi:para-nitrobenzyl esterase
MWTPASAIPGGGLPVLVFLHGGGNTSGSTSESLSELSSSVVLYDGQNLSASNNVLVVTVQYRLGALGFMAHPGFLGNNTQTLAGNYGLLDQIQALQWVQDNISQFGGDPTNVMLFGESAGALDTCMLLVSPAAANLFQGALMQSGGCVARPLAQSLAEGLDISRKVGCEIDPGPALCLRNTPASTLVLAVDTQSIVGGLVRMPFGPTIDGLLIPQEPMSALQAGQFNHLPFIIGSNADEMLPSVPAMTAAAYTTAVHALLDPFGGSFASQALALYPFGPGYYNDGRSAFAALATDSQFTCPARRIARAVESTQVEPVYRYFFSQTLRFPFSSYGAFHGLELAFLFQHLSFPPYYSPSSQELTLMTWMGGYWSRFSASGNPNGSGAATWPNYIPATEPYLELKYAITSGLGIRTKKCDFWDTLPIYHIHLPIVTRP